MISAKNPSKFIPGKFSLAKVGFRVRALEHLHQDDWRRHREGPRKSQEAIDGVLGSHWEKLQKLPKVTKVTKCIIVYKIDHLAS